MPVPDNIVPLSDGAGEVVEVGAGRQAREGRRQGGGLLLPALAGRGGRTRRARQRARRRHRRHAGGIRGAGGGRRRQTPVASVGRGGRDAAVRCGHRLARDDGARKADRRSERSAARHRRCFGVRAAARARARHAIGHHLVERRQARQGEGARRKPHRQLQGHAGLGEGGDGVHR